MKHAFRLLVIYSLSTAFSFALQEHIVEIEPSLPLPNDSWKEIGIIKNFKSSEIAGSRLSIGFECLDRDMFKPEMVYDRLAETGIKWARCQTGWSKCETQKGVYDFKWLDDVVDNLRKRGIQPWFNVGFGNPIYMGKMKNKTGVGYVPIYFGEECQQAWVNYIDALSKHFKGRVQHWEIWNESNIKEFWQPKKPSVDEYIKLIDITGSIIRKNIPDAKIGAVITGSYSWYTKDFFRKGGQKLIDFYAVHPYCVVPEDRFDNDTAAIYDAIAKSKPPRKIELWQGEAGFASYYPKGHGMKTTTSGGEYMQAKWMLRRFTIDLAAGYGLTSLYQCVDLKKGYEMAGGKMDGFGRYGLFKNETYTAKKAVKILSNYTPIFDNQTTPHKIHSVRIDFEKAEPFKLGESMLPLCADRVETFMRKGYPLFAYWITEDVQKQMKPIENVSMYIVNDTKMRTPVLLDIISGKVYKLTGNPFIIRGLPITDYPLIITDYNAVKDIIIEN